MGSEPTPGSYIDALLGIVEECRRVLAPHGSLCFELGDTYSGSGGGGGDYLEGGMREGQPRFQAGYDRRDGRKTLQRADYAAPMTVSARRDRAEVPRNLSGGDGWPLDKSLCLIPELFRFALVYGFNPLTGRETERWRVRNVVRWCRPNPPVGALADKFRPATSDMVIACMSRKRYFDLDAVRGPASPNTHARTARGVESLERSGKSADRGGNWASLPELHAGAPPLDWWGISPKPYKPAHYATWPSALLVKPILAMCPPKVCRTCGAPSERTVEPHRIAPADDRTRTKDVVGANPRSGFTQNVPEIGWEYERNTTGWTDCGHDDYRAGIVLDVFAGSGTTLAVATGHGRDAIGIDLDSRNADLARDRVGMWLTVEHHKTETVA